MNRASISPLLLGLALAACGGEPPPDMTEPDGGPEVTDPAALDGGRPHVELPPPGVPRGCAWETPPEIPDDPLAGDWDRRFALPGLGGGTAAADALAALDDGSIVVGGEFETVGPHDALNVALWTPSAGWSPMGDGLPYGVTALATDGTSVYAATRGEGGWPPPDVQGRVHRWNGTAWETLGGFDGSIEALEVGPDGAVYAGGWFEDVDGVAVTNLARWADGEGWAAVHADQPDDGVSAILVEGDSLCIGGSFAAVGTLATSSVACLSDGAWESRSLLDWISVEALARDPADGSLIAGGHFTLEDAPDGAGGSLVRWVDDHWELIGGGLHNLGGLGPGYVEGLHFIDGALHTIGAFGGAGLPPVTRLESAARYQDGEWDDLDGGLRKRLGVSIGSAVAFASTVDAHGRLVVGGLFSVAGSRSVIGVAAWDGTYWRPLATAEPAASGGVNGNVEAIADDGRCALYVGGNFEYAGEIRANNVARFDLAGGWYPLGEGLPSPVVALAVTDRLPAVGPDAVDGATRPIGGPHGALYASQSTGTGEGILVLWDGEEWSEVGRFDGAIRTIAVDEGGRVAVGGDFTRVGADQPASHVAFWDGRDWRPLGSGLDGEARALAFEEDGTLLVGGRFGSAGGLPAGGIARWDGAGWAPLGEGLEGSYGLASVNAIATRDGEVFVGGDFVRSDGRAVENVARFDGVDWQPVGEGLPGLFVQDVEWVGDALIAAGHFDIGEEEHTVAAFRSDAWEPFAGDTDDLVESIASRPEGLYFAGPFVNAADHPSVGIALFRYAEAE